MSEEQLNEQPEAAPYKPTKAFRSVVEVLQEQEMVRGQAKEFWDRAERENRPLTEAELFEAKRLMAYDELLEKQEKPAALQFEEMSKRNAASTPSGLLQPASHDAPAVPVAMERRALPNVVAKPLKCFSEELFGDKQAAYHHAEEAGHFLRVTLGRDLVNQVPGLGPIVNESLRFCNSRDHLRKLVSPEYMVQNDDRPTGTLGGYLVPEAVSSTILDVRDRYGLIARLCRQYPMIEETDNVPKRLTGLTVEKPTQLTAINPSDKTYGSVQLNARDAWTLTYISHKLMRGAVVDAADQVINEIAYAFAKQQDYEGVNGDGTAGAPNWDINGIVPNIGAGGQVTATGATSFETITAAHINSLIGALPDRFHTRSAGPGDSGASVGPAFVCSHAFFAATFGAIHAAGGGNTMQNLAGDVPFRYLGYPIFFTEEMPNAYASTTCVLLFGNFYEACLLGQREGVNISLSEHHRFNYGQMSIRGQIAYDFNFHEPGNGGAGGIVGLYSPV